MAEKINKELHLKFHGRIIDSLGIQMYQSPVAAIAELVANAWDADAEVVEISLPKSLSSGSRFTIKDTGHGMTFDECQENYLNVGRNRRIDQDSNKSKGGRPVLGRKGIGKLAGFGIAEVVEIETISKATGEKTHFRMDLEALRDDEYVSTNPKKIKIIEATGPDSAQKKEHGTKIYLKKLKLSRRPNSDQFSKSMARRFLLSQVSDNFQVLVDDVPIPEDDTLTNVEFDFPSDYKANEKPDGLKVSKGWGIENIDGEEVRWRIKFTENTITTDEFRGVAVYCGVKVAQTPFFFNLSGGLDGQHGQQYMSGIVQADYLDQLDGDAITTERQRINWELAEARPLESWGQKRTKQLLAIWKERRAEENIKKLDERVGRFKDRLDAFPPPERKIVRGAIRKIATIETLNFDQFGSLAEAILTAWEGGRLKGLISDLATVETMDEGLLLSLLAEAQVLTALHAAETVRTKLDIIHGLRMRIETKELENKVRDYIYENPWLLSPEWDSFKKEISLKTLMMQAAREAKLDDDESFKKRVDLILSSGRQLLLVEFMRPGLTVDMDHINRFQHYVYVLREKIEANTKYDFSTLSGLLVAEKLANRAGVKSLLTGMAKEDMKCVEWHGLLESAEHQWIEFLDVLGGRAPDDPRLKALRTSTPDS
ncbi:hypothetical protein GCM10009096_21610 [Parasphingorhabdus litoris]|uniref:ATP-binding protein n=1 Tax=Parasphingorhabdus litoris TaxID=394733 RepID=A0ABN1AL85_9SPHN|nr:ATP-binding protein [Parasphingorhabdus litoris]